MRDRFRRWADSPAADLLGMAVVFAVVFGWPAAFLAFFLTRGAR